MSKNDPEIKMRHMLDYAREAVALSDRKSREDIAEERVLNLALIRLVEIIGEAANRIQKDSQELYPQIPWTQIISMRNRLIHGYDFIDYDILWKTVNEDLPLLINQLEGILED